MSSTILATAGRIIHRLIDRHGLEADAMFLSAGLDPQKLNDPQARYPLERTRAFRDRCTSRSRIRAGA